MNIKELKSIVKECTEEIVKEAAYVPGVKKWKIVIKETGEVFIIEAVTKQWARGMFKFKHPEHYGKEIKIDMIR